MRRSCSLCRNLFLPVLCLALLVFSLHTRALAEGRALEGWTEGSPSLASILDYVASLTDPASPAYVTPAERIAVFDMDGTLYGECFPTYFDDSILIHRLLHDETYQASDAYRAYALAMETALLAGSPEPDTDLSGAQVAAEAFQGLTPEAYQAYVRSFMQLPVIGFEGMTYAEGFYVPMVSLVRYLAEQDFRVFISSGSERLMVRELMKDALGQWIPPYQVIGSTFTLTAAGQGDKAGRSYTYTAEDQVLLEGNLVSKNLKMNKVVTIIQEIGLTPQLVFGNSSGDLSMAVYAMQDGGRAYMLLCDDTVREHGDPDKAASFLKTCTSLGCETISMRDDFATIYGADVVRTAYADAQEMR